MGCTCRGSGINVAGNEGEEESAGKRTSSTKCLAMVPLYRLFLRHCAAISPCTSAVSARRAAASSMARSACRLAAMLIRAMSAAAVPGAGEPEAEGEQGTSACSKLIGLMVI